MNALTKAGKSIVLISSDHDELLAMSDRVAIVQHGEVKKVVVANELSHDDLVRASADQIQHPSKEHVVA
jgi:ribose transport system ATP-binding protein